MALGQFLVNCEILAEGLKTVGGVIGGAFGGPAGVSAGTAIGGLLGTGLTAFFAKRTTPARDAAFDEGVARGAVTPTPHFLPSGPRELTLRSECQHSTFQEVSMGFYAWRSPKRPEYL
jgi:hypothetical protein